VTLVTVRPVLRTGPRAGFLPAECFAQRNVTTVGKSLVRVGTVADCCTVPIAATADSAAGRYRGGGGGRRCRRRRPHRVHGRRVGVRRRGVRRRRVARGRHIRLRLDNHLRALADDAALVVGDHECRILLLSDAHVVARVGLLHYVPWPCARECSRLGRGRVVLQRIRRDYIIIRDLTPLAFAYPPCLHLIIDFLDF